MNVVLVEVEETLNIRPKSQNTGSEMEGSSDGSGCDCRRTIARILLRLSAVGLTCFVAIMVPFFPDVMSLVGAMCLTMIVFILPVFFSFRLRGQKMSLIEKVWGICIVCCGSIGGLIGTIQAFQSIAAKFVAA